MPQGEPNEGPERGGASAVGRTEEPPEDLRGPGAEEGLHWTPRPMVHWFDPGQLWLTGLRAGISRVFGQYADRREIQAALRSADEEGGPDGSPVHRYSEENELWLDYVADLGDGFESTYSQAWLLSRPELAVKGAEGQPDEMVDMPRGRLLILGGDQVYPTASRSAYRDRFAGPYRAAFPWCAEEPAPDLFAVPGNHDWYDGLSSFLRLFCQGRWIGGWKTRQSRSYFALELPHRWWLLATDIQLGTDIDRPQIDYFRRVAAEMEAGDRVVICCAEPLWLKGESSKRSREEAYEPLAFMERRILPDGVRVALTMAGDLHHYARYTDEETERQRFTCGGGGAYLSGTHRLPESVDVPRHDAPEPARRSAGDFEASRQRTTYPDRETSVKLKIGALLLPLRNPHFLWLPGAIYLLYAWLLQSASRDLGEGFLQAAAALGPGAADRVLGQWWRVAADAPALVVFSVLVVVATTAFAEPDDGRPPFLRYVVGSVHGAVHLALAVGLTWALARFELGVLGWEAGEFPQLVLFAVAMLVLGGTAGGIVTGLSMLTGVNDEYAFSSQHLPSFNSFLRLHIDDDGVLTVYPVGVEEPGQWRFVPHADPDQSRYEPAGEPPRPRLVESPIRVPDPGSDGGS